MQCGTQLTTHVNQDTSVDSTLSVALVSILQRALSLKLFTVGLLLQNIPYTDSVDADKAWRDKKLQVPFIPI